jgi:hypothetical protein
MDISLTATTMIFMTMPHLVVRALPWSFPHPHHKCEKDGIGQVCVNGTTFPNTCFAQKQFPNTPVIDFQTGPCNGTTTAVNNATVISNAITSPGAPVPVSDVNLPPKTPTSNSTVCDSGTPVCGSDGSPYTNACIVGECQNQFPKSPGQTTSGVTPDVEGKGQSHAIGAMDDVKEITNCEKYDPVCVRSILATFPNKCLALKAGYKEVVPGNCVKVELQSGPDDMHDNEKEHKKNDEKLFSENGREKQINDGDDDGPLE